MCILLCILPAQIDALLYAFEWDVFVFTEFPFKTVSGDVTAFHRVQYTVISSTITPYNAELLLYKSWRPNVFFLILHKNLHKIKMTKLALSDSFEYAHLCSGSTAVSDIFFQCGDRIRRLQTSDSDVESVPRAGRFKGIDMAYF